MQIFGPANVGKMQDMQIAVLENVVKRQIMGMSTLCDMGQDGGHADLYIVKCRYLAECEVLCTGKFKYDVEYVDLHTVKYRQHSEYDALHWREYLDWKAYIVPRG